MTPINMITVICDASTMQTIRIACRCGRQWIERIPQELHDSELIAQFDCTCGRVHLLRNHQLLSLTKEEFHDRFNDQATDGSRFAVRRPDQNIKYDA
jgi:hypothetical protein